MINRSKRVEPTQRQLFVVDIENVIGGAATEADAVRWAKAVITDAVAVRPGDHVVVGISHAGLLTTGCAWTDLRYVVGSGLDGADRALLEVLEERVAERYTHVVLVSGDGIFTDAVARLAAAGVETTVVAHPAKLSNRLRLAAHHVTHLCATSYPNSLDAA